MNEQEKSIVERMIKSSSYHREFAIRTATDDNDSENQMIVEGKAVVFDEETLLFKLSSGLEVYEKIDRHALDDVDTEDCYFKFNHSDAILPLARVKNKTLTLDVRDDGMYIKANIANTSQGRDLYQLIKARTIDKMSFAFSIQDQERQESDDGNKITYIVKKIKKLYDVAAVNLPAYKSTDLYARRREDVETFRSMVKTEKREQELKLARAKAIHL